MPKCPLRKCHLKLFLAWAAGTNPTRISIRSEIEFYGTELQLFFRKKKKKEKKETTRQLTNVLIPTNIIFNV